MARLLGFRIKNYRSLADVTFGRVKHNQGEELPGLTCLIGANGSGKSNVLDALGFISDTLKEGVEAACDKPHRGGFRKLRTQGQSGAMEFHLYYREADAERPITYVFSVDDENGVPVVMTERLLQGKQAGGRGKPYTFLDLKKGKGLAWRGDADAETGDMQDREEVNNPAGELAVASLGALRDHPRIRLMRAYLQDWYLSYFVPDAARLLPPTGAQKHLNRDGSNIGNVLQYLERKDPALVKLMLSRIAKAVPGLRAITTKKSPDNRLLLEFNEDGFKDPFFQQSMSDGTLKMVAYLLLISDPEPARFVGLEEPENGLYHQLFGPLAREFLKYVGGLGAKTQMLVTTHAPLFVDALTPEQVWVLTKEKGNTKVKRAADIPDVKGMADEHLPLGSLWFSGHLGVETTL